MDRYITKDILYRAIDLVRKELDILDQSFPLNLINICEKRNDIEIGYMNFKTKGLRGMAVKYDNNGDNDIIILDSKQSKSEQNFYCGHELIHLTFHRNFSPKSFNCYEKTLPNQNKFIEWQANEGSAELLVPYKIFIPMYVNLCMEYKKDFLGIRKGKILAEYFGVSTTVIDNRIKNLQYEIYQYYKEKKDIDNIELISLTRQRQLGKNNLSAEIPICPQCLSYIEKSSNFCKICGRENKFFGLTKGLNAMKYKHDFKAYENGKLLECPRCHNEEIENSFCRICGTELTNKCTQCESILPLNARYCSFCGAKSTYFEQQILLPWDAESIDDEQIPDLYNDIYIPSDDEELF